MKLPEEQTWLRVEALAEGLSGLSESDAAARVAQLAAAGESPTVLTLLGAWIALPPPSAPVGIGDEIGSGYTLREKLGEGGMGSVWRATQRMIHRDVALKMIHPALVTPALQARFSDEVKLLGQLNHAGIVKIFDAGVHQATTCPAIPYFAMELVAGVPLDRWAAEHRNDWVSQLRLAAAVCVALQSAHDQRIVHRDLKPANILVKNDGQPVVLDFGIARLAGMADGDAPGLFSGTPQYAAPEQHMGRDRDFRSGESVDVYAVGAIVFEMLSGRRLFEFARGTPVSEMRRAVLEAPVPRLSEVASNCPIHLDEIIARAVRRNPADRYYSIAALGRALARAASAMDSPQPAAPPWKPAVAEMIPGTEWKLDRKIGEGSAGEVWLGTHERLKERRVFKFCDTEEKARTLKRELTLFRLLKERIGQNPHFIQLHEVSLDEPPFYLMMSHEDVQDLDSWCAAQPGGSTGLSLETRIEIVSQTAEAMQAAHEAGILHRDIKPGNILVRTTSPAPASGGPPSVHIFVADFGIGQIVANELLLAETHLGFTRTITDLQRAALSGTMLYMAPEVLEGTPATARSDIYSLGIVLWQLLIGNLSAALDPADWSVRIQEPLLRDDIARCLAGSPAKRWASAGELAASLRALPARREAEARRAAELAAREQAAYRRGVLGTATVATAIIAVVAGLAWFAWEQRSKAERATGRIALEQAGSLRQTDLEIGRRERGLRLLETAAATVTNHHALRTAAAAVFNMPDLERVPAGQPSPATTDGPTFPAAKGESCRTVSSDGTILAVARDLDGLNGTVDLIHTATGERRATIERKQFPWVPIAEVGMLRFSSDNLRLAMGGAATSRHVLICNVADGSLQSYLFHGSDPLSCAWHPGGRLLAIGCADGTVRIWDTAAAVSASKNPRPGSQFDLPPLLDVPALDQPLQILRGHRGAVRQAAFSTGGRWLATVDDTGYLRIHTGFSREGLPQLPSVEQAGDSELANRASSLHFAVEARLDQPERITELAATADRLIIRRGSASAEEFKFVPGELPVEAHLASEISGLAWNGDGTELCAITPTDVHWLSAAPLERYFTAAGSNRVSVAWRRDNGRWMLPKTEWFDELKPVQADGVWDLEHGSSFRLSAALKNQGALTFMAATGNGLTAVYYGRRIQFFARGQEAGLEDSIVADGTDGEIRGIQWDYAGRLLSAVFSQPDGRLRFEAWATSGDFPPKCRPLPTRTLECQRIVAANDENHCIARSRQRGVFRFDPATGIETEIDSSNVARQNAPMAARNDGKLLALIVDQNTVRLVGIPDGALFAELRSHRPTAVTQLIWDSTGRRLASVTEDGYVQVWQLGPWLDWLASHSSDNEK